MKKYLHFAFLAILLGISGMFVGCTKVPAGNVGVKVYLLGSDKGVSNTEILGPGRYYVGFNEELYIFPTFSQNYVWTKDATEGSPNDESISFQTKEGLEVSADFGITYTVNEDKVPALFQKYRRGIEEITDTYLRNMVRDAINNRASTLPVESVYGEGKQKLILSVQEDVQASVGDMIKIEKIYLIGTFRLPPSVVTALNLKIEATQKAQQRENEVAQAKAEADKEVARADGEARAKLSIAEAEAKAITIRGAALRANPEVIQLNAVARWNGVLPTFIGGGAAMPFIDLSRMPAVESKPTPPEDSSYSAVSVEK
jgi:regulator of protease activity HflC (stomatin/prohibitin superfamily)